MQRIRLAPDYEISRVIRGGWQLAVGHGKLVGDDPVADMVAFADAGITTFDCADIYTGVEELVGRFRRRYGELRGAAALARIKMHTKFVPDLEVLPRITRAYVERGIDESLRRLNLERLDLVQFHWWDFGVPRWLETAGWLEEFRRAGKIHKLSATNFDTDRMLALLQSGVKLTSMQVQYSLLDRRPARRLVPAAQAHGVALLCYGTVAGGFLADAWLGRSEPAEPFENRSLVKYKLIIDEMGGWALFQHLLETLRGIADSHHTDIAAVASAAVLARPGVAAVIVGARNRAHLEANLAISRIVLTPDEQGRIDAVLAAAKELPGEVYGLERDRNSRHGAIMKYNLNEATG